MTLAEWLADFPYKPHIHDSGCISIPDRADYHKHRQLWDLTDYFVSSRTGGNVNLLPRNPDDIHINPDDPRY